MKKDEKFEIISNSDRNYFEHQLALALTGDKKVIGFQVVANPHFGVSRFVEPGDFTGPLIYFAMIS
jgi:hypothetical protein